MGLMVEVMPWGVSGNIMEYHGKLAQRCYKNQTAKLGGHHLLYSFNVFKRIFTREMLQFDACFGQKWVETNSQKNRPNNSSQRAVKKRRCRHLSIGSWGAANKNQCCHQSLVDIFHPV